MSGVWTEKSVPMTDHECAVEALKRLERQFLQVIKIKFESELTDRNGPCRGIMAGIQSE